MTSATPLAALLTPSGRGAIASIRISGGGTAIEAAWLFTAANGRRLAHQSLNQIVFGRWGRNDGAKEDVVACRLDADTLEIHCHGGHAAADRILWDLRSLGFCVIPWEDFVAAVEGPFAAECARALSQASTQRCAAILLDQVSGTFASAIKRLSQDRTQNGIDSILQWAEFGLHLTQPWRVVLTGRPNVGKSSLGNSLLGYGRTIVSEQPGTTRDVVTAETALDGWPVRLADTAGIRTAVGPIEAEGIARAKSSLAGADLQIVVLDRSQPPTGDDWMLLGEWPQALVVANKIDLADAWGQELPRSALPVSCTTGAGIDVLAAEIPRRLVPRVPPPLTAVPFTERQVELLRRGELGAMLPG